jgi:hypothetical protein
VAGGGVDLSKQLEGDAVVGFLAVAVAGEGDCLRLNVELDGRLGDVGGRDGQEDPVARGVCCGGALSPGDCKKVVSCCCRCRSDASNYLRE